MLDFFTSPYFLLFARLCVAGVFLASGIGKLMDKEGTAASMSRYPFLPSGAGRLIANVFPILEIIVGAFLLVGFFTRYAALLAVAMFVLFTGLLIYDLSRGKNQSCHCFGRISDEKLTPMAVVRNVALMLISLLVALAFDGWLAVDTTLNNATNGSLGLITLPPSGSAGPTLAESVPVILLALATIGAIVLGGPAVSTVRTALRGISPR
ncbi:MAG TPA: MauE/DoxX family redox-associated membrane protein [Chloroflexia bacterium]|jgi:uncharacterized membrane protein YphA (DoxX/SURF4 family)